MKAFKRWDGKFLWQSFKNCAQASALLPDQQLNFLLRAHFNFHGSKVPNKKLSSDN